MRRIFHVYILLSQERCLTLLHDHPKREELLSVLMDAGEEAWNRGAHEASPKSAYMVIVDLMEVQLAIRSFTSARALLRNNPWSDHPHRTYVLFSRLASYVRLCSREVLGPNAFV